MKFGGLPEFFWDPLIATNVALWPQLYAAFGPFGPGPSSP